MHQGKMEWFWEGLSVAGFQLFLAFILIDILPMLPISVEELFSGIVLFVVAFPGFAIVVFFGQFFGKYGHGSTGGWTEIEFIVICAVISWGIYTWIAHNVMQSVRGRR